MTIDDIRGALVTFVSQLEPVALAIVQNGIHAGIWLRERAGLPPTHSSLLLLMPFTLPLLLCLAFAHWRGRHRVRVTKRSSGAPPATRVVQRQQPFTRPTLDSFQHRRPLNLDGNDLPRNRLALEPLPSVPDWQREVERYLQS